VLDRIAVGAIANVYRCRFSIGSREFEGILKVARDQRTSGMIAHEAAVLKHLAARDAKHVHAAFVPQLHESLAISEAGGVSRQASVLGFAGPVQSVDDLYTLEEVLAAHPGGLDPRDMAWIWRRLLSILGHVHSLEVLHTAVLPMHVLIEPRLHGLILIDWCGGVMQFRTRPQSLHMIHGTHAAWYRSAGVLGLPVSDGLDIDLAARCMIQLIGGDPLRGTCPAAVEPSIVRHLQRCLAAASELRAGAWELLRDFDQLIQTLWGPRAYRELSLPPKRRH
jgi:hypothetical protein